MLCGAAAKAAKSTTSRDLLAARPRAQGDRRPPLSVPQRTVEHHVARLRQKFDATNRAEFVAALRAKLAH